MRVRRRDERGYVMYLTAGLLTVMVALAGFGVDLGIWYSQAQDTQSAVDAAALAGVVYMPGDFTTASSVATATLAKNGIVNGTDGYSVSISAVTGQPQRLKVCATDTAVDTYLSKIVSADPTIQKCATAEYVLPVAMGSPLNIFSQSALGIHAAVSGYCAAKEDGDLRQAHSEGNRPFGGTWPNPPYGGGSTCDAAPGTPNADYRLNGSHYIVAIPPSGMTTSIEAWSATYAPAVGAGCGMSTDGCDSTNNNAPAATPDITTIMTVFDATDTPLDSSDDPIVATHTIAKNDAAWTDWNTLYTAPAGGPQRYRVRVQTQAGQAASAGSNSYGLRAAVGGSFTQCTTIVGAPGYTVTCPQVYAEDDLSIFANVAGSTATFYLADIEAVHAGKTLQIQLFDPGEGGQSIEILDPNGNPVNFSYSTVEGFSPTYSGTTSLLDVSGTPGAQLNRRSASTFNERKVAIQISLPANYASMYGSSTWWRLRYTFAGGAASVTDRTTWSVAVVGEPLRLVPNS